MTCQFSNDRTISEIIVSGLVPGDRLFVASADKENIFCNKIVYEDKCSIFVPMSECGFIIRVRKFGILPFEVCVPGPCSISVIRIRDEICQ